MVQLQSCGVYLAVMEKSKAADDSRDLFKLSTHADS